MTDLFRVVELSPGGRPRVLIDLEDGAFFSKVKGSLRLVPGQRTTVQARQPGRYGGTLPVDDRKDNASIEGQWAVMGASEDECARKAELLCQRVEEAARGRYLEFRPGGVTRAVYPELRGPGTWSPVYDRDLLSQQQAMVFDLAFPVAPLADLLPMDVGDPFDVDSREDYTFDAATSADVGTDGTALVPVVGAALTVERAGIHTVRGYPLLEGQATLRFVPGATITAFKAGVRLRRSAPGTFVEVYIDDDGTNSRLRTDVVIGGTRTNRQTDNLATRVGFGTPGWVRGRVEGDAVFAEYFEDEATPSGAPDLASQYALAGAELPGLPAGELGWSWVPQHADARLGRFEAEAFVRRDMTFPGEVAFRDAVPGSAPARFDLHFTPSGGTAAPVFCLVGWTARPLEPVEETDPGKPFFGARVPFGGVQAEDADTVATWAVTVDADYRHGQGLQATASGAGEASAEWVVDPSTLVPDEFAGGELELEVWGRVELASTLVSPKLVLSAVPGAAGFGTERFAAPLLGQGKLLVKPSSGTRFRPVRLGSLPLVCDRQRPVAWRLRLAGSWAAGSSGVFGIDELYLCPAGRRAASPSGRANDDSYPKFVASTAQTEKIVRSDLSGAVATPPDHAFPDHGLGGAQLELPPGELDVLVKLSSLVPDDPTSSAASEQMEHSASVHLAVTPRVHLLG